MVVFSLCPAEQMSMRRLPFGPSSSLGGISGNSPSPCSGLHPKELLRECLFHRNSSSAPTGLNRTLQRLQTPFVCLSSPTTPGLGREKEQQ